MTVRALVLSSPWHKSRGIRRDAALASRTASWLTVVPLLLACGLDSSYAQAPMRVVAARDSVVLRTCARTSCDVVAELSRGRAVEVLKTDGAWYQVLVTLEGRRATTGWVAIAEVTSAPIATVVSTPGAAATPARTAPVGGGASGSATPNTVSTSTESACLACLATRTTTSGEWNQALAITSAIKAPIAPAVTPPVSPVPVATASRAEVVRRDGRSTVERMRDDVNERFGPDLKRLSELALDVAPALQDYMSSCYDKYLPVPSVPPAGAPPVAERADRPRATMFDLWKARPAFSWNESWSTNPLLSADSTAFCQTLWNRVHALAGEVKVGVEQIESAARSADIYPGVLREVLETYGLAEGR